MTIHFRTFGPSTLTQDRPLWTRLKYTNNMSTLSSTSFTSSTSMWPFLIGDIFRIWWQNETNEKMNSWYLFILWLYYSIFLVRKLNKCLNCGFVVVSDLLYVYSKILQTPTEQTISVTPRSDVSPNPDDPGGPGALNNKIKRVRFNSGNTSYKLLKLEHEEPRITRRMDRMIE